VRVRQATSTVPGLETPLSQAGGSFGLRVAVLTRSEIGPVPGSESGRGVTLRLILHQGFTAKVHHGFTANVHQ
jgi:hypothetical protein